MKWELGQLLYNFIIITSALKFDRVFSELHFVKKHNVNAPELKQSWFISVLAITLS
jgi:hypothetical protein